jgi:hypothetical protein
VTKGRTVRIRQLTPGQVQRLQALRRVARMLDSAIPLPGTTFRFGLDPMLGLVPGLGDLVSPLFTIAILWQGNELRIPKVVQLRMVVNVAIDALVGMVPIVGDLFDFAWKANDKNIVLLEAHAFEERHAAVGDWLFVGVMILILLVVAVTPFVLAGWLLSALFGSASRTAA